MVSPNRRTPARMSASARWCSAIRYAALRERRAGEVASLTTGPYLHVGGDEAKATRPEDYGRS